MTLYNVQSQGIKKPRSGRNMASLKKKDLLRLAGNNPNIMVLQILYYLIGLLSALSLYIQINSKILLSLANNCCILQI